MREAPFPAAEIGRGGFDQLPGQQSQVAGGVAGGDAAVAVDRQFAGLAGGVRFGNNTPAPRLQQCGQQLDFPTACTLPRAADGSFALYGGARSGQLIVDPGQPVAAVSLRAAPANSANLSLPVTIELHGWANGDTVEIARAVWDPKNTPGWLTLSISAQTETRAALAPLTDRYERFSISAATRQGRPVRVLVDRLQFLRMADLAPLGELGPSTGLLGAMASTRPVSQRGAEIVQTGGLQEGALYPSAEVRRAEIDWSAARREAQAQRRGLNLVLSPALQGFDRVTLPVLMPSAALLDGESAGARAAQDVIFHGREDFYFVTLPTEYGLLTVHGTRRLTVTPGAAELGPGQIRVMETEDGAAASFTAYGASYRAQLACAEPGDEPDCRNPERLRDAVDRLFIFYGRGAGR